jgi:hypothetical protein
LSQFSPFPWSLFLSLLGVTGGAAITTLLHITRPWGGNADKTTWKGGILAWFGLTQQIQHRFEHIGHKDPILNMVFKLCKQVIQAKDNVEFAKPRRDTDGTTPSHLVKGAGSVDDLQKQNSNVIDIPVRRNQLIQGPL